MRVRAPRGAVRIALAVSVTLVALSLGSVDAAGSDPAQIGSWAAPVPMGVIGIHAALLPSGKVLFYELPGSTLERARVFDPVTGVSTVVDPGLDWSVFCSGMSIMPDGRVFATGGEPPRTTTNPIGTGIASAVFFDPGTDVWTPAPPMHYPRWYPTNVSMPDGSVLVAGGESAPTGADKMIKPMETFDPSTDSWSTLPASANLTGLYPRMMLLPDGHVLKVGPQRATRDYDPATKSWTTVAPMLYGARQAGGAVLLPGLDRVLTAGGGTGSKVTATSEILDLSAAKPKWTFTGPMQIARMHQNFVLLPDGTVLAVGGGQKGNFGNPVRTAELFDPATGTWRTMATQVAPRSYHSTALLLPDGRVISAGSNSGKAEETMVEIYSPPYLFAGSRPVVSSAPSSIGYGGSFDVQTPDASSIARVAVLHLGATTHGWAAEQRYVDLNFTKGAGVLHVSGPSGAAAAPAGPYMLFILNGAGVPSVAPILFLG
jgi:hypothetical protein